MNQTIGIWIVRKEAEALARRLAAETGAEVYLVTEGSSNRESFAAHYRECRQWVLIMTTGIAVRYLQGLPQDKATDPGVVLLDEGARFAISLLGGHEGGANALAYKVANLTGAVPVITTATESLKPLVIGIGCRKDISADTISEAINRGLQLISRNLSEVREIATIDLKANESGILEYCEKHSLPLRVIRRELIEARPWVTQPSEWVREKVGVDGVCEPCALLATFRGKLILRKTTLHGVAVAIVEEGS